MISGVLIKIEVHKIFVLEYSEYTSIRVRVTRQPYRHLELYYSAFFRPNTLLPSRCFSSVLGQRLAWRNSSRIALEPLTRCLKRLRVAQ